jgi:hypothetical protein
MSDRPKTKTGKCPFCGVAFKLKLTGYQGMLGTKGNFYYVDASEPPHNCEYNPPLKELPEKEKFKKKPYKPKPAYLKDAARVSAQAQTTPDKGAGVSHDSTDCAIEAAPPKKFKVTKHKPEPDEGQGELFS